MTASDETIICYNCGQPTVACLPLRPDICAGCLAAALADADAAMEAIQENRSPPAVSEFDKRRSVSREGSR